MKTKTTRVVCALALVALGGILGRATQPEAIMAAQATDRVFEIRIYTVQDGKVDRLADVFRSNVTEMFARHGMENVAYFIPDDDPLCQTAAPTSTIPEPVFDERPCSWSKDTLIYVLGHESRDAAAKNWESFVGDAEGLRSFREDYAREGVKVMKIESAFMSATDFSPLK